MNSIVLSLLIAFIFAELSSYPLQTSDLKALSEKVDMTIFDHSLEQVLAVSLLLVLVARIILGTELGGRFFAWWVGLGLLMFLGLPWVPPEGSVPFLVLCVFLCVLLLCQGLERAIPISGGHVLLFSSLCLVYGIGIWTYQHHGQLPIFLDGFSGFMSLFGASLLKNFVSGFGKMGAEPVPVLARGLGFVLALLAIGLAWTANSRELSFMLSVASFLLLGYTLTENLSRQSAA